MIAALPPDRALPGLHALLDEEAVIALLSANLKGGEGLSITGCHPRYIRYKPETSCLVQYDLTIATGPDRCVTTGAYIRIFADDRAHRRATGSKMRRLLDGAPQYHPDLSFRPAAFLPDIKGLFQIYPIDYELRFLARAADASSMTQELHQTQPLFEGCDITGRPDLVRYKPERKALLRYRLRNAPVETMYGKLLTDERGELLVAQTQALTEAGVPTPPVVVSIPKRKFVAHDEAAGVQLAALRGDDSYTGWMEPLAETVTQLHAVELPAAAVHPLADEVAVINDTALWLERIAPRLAHRLDHLSDEISSQLGNMDEQLVTSHGDFYDDQALVSDAGISIIDLDELRRSHPLLDIGNMLAHLTSGAARGDDVGSARDAFLDAALRYVPYCETDVALFEAAALLKLAPGPFRRLEPDWPDGVERIVGLAESRIAGRCTSAWSLPRPMTAGGHADSSNRSVLRVEDRVQACDSTRNGVVAGVAHAEMPDSDDALLADPELPQLRRLQNTGAMSESFTAAFGNGPVSVTGIEVVRHKPGRRAILRYEVEREGSAPGRPEYLYGKTFASNRGGRVYNVTRSITTAQAFGPEIALPEPVAFLPDERLIVQRAVAGRSIETALLNGDVALVASIATALHRFHQSGLRLGRTHELARELSPLPGRTEQLCAEHPALSELAHSLLSRAEAQGRTAFLWRHQPIHRDFYHDQVLEHDEKLAVLDLDDASMSEPAIDVANFSAHLILLGAQKRGYAAALAPLQHAFVRRYCRLDPDIDGELLRFLTATTLLRLAGIHAPRENGRFVATSLLAESGRLFGARSPLVA